MVRLIGCAVVITFLSACSMNNSSTENSENRFVYPYKSMYKGVVKYYAISGREPLSEGKCNPRYRRALSLIQKAVC